MYIDRFGILYIQYDRMRLSWSWLVSIRIHFQGLPKIPFPCGFFATDIDDDSLVFVKLKLLGINSHTFFILHISTKTPREFSTTKLWANVALWNHRYILWQMTDIYCSLSSNYYLLTSLIVSENPTFCLEAIRGHAFTKTSDFVV